MRYADYAQLLKTLCLEGFTGVGHSVEDCLYQARWGMLEHVALLQEQSLPVPPANPNPRVTIQNAAVGAA